MKDKHMKRLAKGQRVEARNEADILWTGTIINVFPEEDGGDFEYYVEHDGGGGSFWPRECLTPIGGDDE